MLFRSNLLVLVGGGRNPRFPANKAMVFDHRAGQYVAELEFRSDIKAVRVRKDRLVVVLLSKIFVYTFSASPERLYTFDTADNEEGVCALCYEADRALLAYPSRQEGYIQVVDLQEQARTSIIRAHKSRIAALAFSPSGAKLASASRKGTLVRIFDVASCRPEGELRRGSDRAMIYSLCFSYDALRLCVASDKGTVHVFKLDALVLTDGFSDEEAEEEAPRAAQSAKAMVKGLLPKYFSSRWSFAHFCVPDSRCLAAFGAEKNTVVVVGVDGGYYKYSFDLAKGGECVRQAYNKFLHIGVSDVHL